MNKIKLIKSIASKLPERYFTQSEQIKISGEDLLLSGQSEVNGIPIDKEKIYLMQNPVFETVNHAKRLNKAYQREGVKGIKLYVKHITNLAL